VPRASAVPQNNPAKHPLRQTPRPLPRAAVRRPDAEAFAQQPGQVSDGTAHRLLGHFLQRRLPLRRRLDALQCGAPLLQLVELPLGGLDGAGARLVERSRLALGVCDFPETFFQFKL